MPGCFSIDPAVPSFGSVDWPNQKRLMTCRIRLFIAMMAKYQPLKW